MSSGFQLINPTTIQKNIFTIRGKQVMIDRDLAEMYGVETKVLNQAVKRNLSRFPAMFRFQLTKEEETIVLRSQIVTLNNPKRGQRSKYLPYAFTEQGISMLSAVLKSETAIKVSIQIMNAFVEMRKLISTNYGLFQRIETMEKKQLITDEKFETLFQALEENTLKTNQGIFYDGQVYDAHILVTDIIHSAKNSIIVIDNYIDESVLTLLTKRKKNVQATIFTKHITKQIKLDLEKHNAQYPPITIKEVKNSHDRFLIIDENTIYHIGASLKDLGKKWFAFSKFENGALKMIQKLQSK